MAYQLPWYEDEDEVEVEVDGDGSPPDRTFTAQDYTLAYALGVDDNAEAEAVVVSHLRTHRPDLLARVSFDSERGCFFAYTATREDMDDLVGVVSGLVESRHPDAIPGTITSSPAYIRRWEDLTGR